MNPQAKNILERLRTGRLPRFGSIRWDGQNGQAITAVNFEFNRAEPAEVVCGRAYEFFLQLSPQEWEALDIEITTRDGKPVRAILKPLRAGLVSTGRLRQLEAGIKD